MSPKEKFIVRSSAVIFYKNKLLTVRHGKDFDYLALPGGHLEHGEDVKECLERELIEELGVKPKIGRLLYVHTFIDENNIQPVEFFFEVKNGKDYLNIEKNSRSHAFEISEICWLTPSDKVKILPQKFAEDFQKKRIKFNETRYIKG